MFENNSVELKGRIGNEIHLNHSHAGYWVKASICTNVPLQNSDGIYYIKDIWHSVLFFGINAKSFASSFKKGDICVVRGYLDYNTKSSEDGTKVKFTNIIAINFGSQKDSTSQDIISEVNEPVAISSLAVGELES